MMDHGSEETGQLADGVRSGDVLRIARALSIVENGHTAASSLMHSLFDPARREITIGVTGPPGAGKSSLTSRLISYWRGLHRRVGVIAVDPSSPFSGGALLGDRVRMQEHASDSGVFIRSMGSRGHLGGLAGSTRDALEILSAASYDPVIVETVGVGQAEVEVASLADITILVLVPGLGDEVQAMKAGIMEIGDVIVLNKADRPGIDQLEASVSASLEMMPAEAVRPPVIRTSARTGEGIDDLTSLLSSMARDLANTDEVVRRRVSLTLESILRERGRELARRIVHREFHSTEKAVDSIIRGDTTPYEIGELIAGYTGTGERT